MRQRLELLWLIPVLAVALFLRTQHLANVSYWFDEAFSIKMAEFPILELLDRARNDPSPPLFYLLLKGWMGIFGSSITAIRIYGSICGTAAVLGVFLFVRESSRLGQQGSKTKPAIFIPLLAATFVALSPIHIKWSLLVRMYSLGTALAAFSSYFLMRALRETPTSTRDWRLFTVTAILMIYTHYFGLFTVVAEFLFALGYCYLQRPATDSQSMMTRLRPALISAASVYAAFLPWLIPFLDHRQMVDEKFPIPPLTVDMVGATLFTAVDLELLFDFSSQAGLIAIQAYFVIVILTLMSRRPGDLYVALAASFPILTAIAVSLLMRHLFVQRYFQFVQPFLLIAVAVLIGRIPWSLVKFTIAFLLVVVMANQASRQYAKRDRDAQLPGMLGAMAYFDSVRKPHQPLVACNPMLYQPAIQHTQNRDAIYASGSARDYPYFQGTAVMRDDEYLSVTQRDAKASEDFWTLDAERWFNGTWAVPTSPEWNVVDEERFPEFNAELVLRHYHRDPQTRPVTSRTPSEENRR